MNNYFKECKTIEELKTKYRKITKQYHPDITKTDTTEIMAQLNNDYQERMYQLNNNINENVNNNIYEDVENETANTYNYEPSTKNYEYEKENTDKEYVAEEKTFIEFYEENKATIIKWTKILLAAGLIIAFVIKFFNF